MGSMIPSKQIHHHHYHTSHQKNERNQIQNRNNVFEKIRIPESNNFHPSKKSQKYEPNRLKNQPIFQENRDLDFQEQEDKNIIEKNMLDQQAKRLQKIIKQYEQNIQKAKQYGRKMNDFTKYYQFKSQSLTIYVQKLKQMKFEEKAVGHDGICRKAVIGRISCGKSSFLNNLLDLDLMVGAGQTTIEPSVVYKKGKIQIIDTPGQNEDFNSQNVQNIRNLAQINEVFILYPDSLKNVEHLVRTVCAIKPSFTYLVRTNCDRASKDQNKTLQQEIESDYKVLQSWKITNIPIFATSAKSKKLFQNQIVKGLLENYPHKH